MVLRKEKVKSEIPEKDDCEYAFQWRQRGSQVRYARVQGALNGRSG